MIQSQRERERDRFAKYLCHSELSKSYTHSIIMQFISNVTQSGSTATAAALAAAAAAKRSNIT